MTTDFVGLPLRSEVARRDSVSARRRARIAGVIGGMLVGIVWAWLGARMGTGW